MKISILNFSDREGGASRAAYRLHQGLRKIGLDSMMLVQSKESDDDSVIGPQGKINKGFAMLRPHLDSVPGYFYKHRQPNLWSPAWQPKSNSRSLNQEGFDVHHLHWICRGFIPVTLLSKISGPLVWTLHDSWPFTGGCHVPLTCTRYQESCGCCPQLGSARNLDLSRWVWKRKSKYWRNLNLIIVSPSRWLADCARSSSLFRNLRIEVIPNGLDLSLFRPLDRAWARDLLGLPREQTLILSGALGVSRDPRKGFSHLQEALKVLTTRGWHEKTSLIMVGSSAPKEPVDISLKSFYLGTFHDEISMALLYAAVDVLVAPYVQDNLSNVVMEALACGIPVVAFDVGGMPDMVDHLQVGYLAQPFDTADLARGIEWILADPERCKALSQAARSKAEKEYDISSIANRYAALYRSVLLG
jgi:glycosyltransferase involved in cell wall biosynthesis